LSKVIAYNNLVDMLDFSRTNFSKTITLTAKKNTVIESKWPLVKLEDVAQKFFAGGDAPKVNFSKTKTDKLKIPIYANGFENKGLYGYTNTAIVNEPCITISARGTLGYTEIRLEPFVPIVRLIVLVPNNKTTVQYLKIAISLVDFNDSGAVIPQLTVPKVKSIKIPLPPKKVQQKLIDEFDKFDKTKNQFLLQNMSSKEYEKIIHAKKMEIIKKHL